MRFNVATGILFAGNAVDKRFLRPYLRTVFHLFDGTDRHQSKRRQLRFRGMGICIANIIAALHRLHTILTQAL